MSSSAARYSKSCNVIQSNIFLQVGSETHLLDDLVERSLNGSPASDQLQLDEVNALPNADSPASSVENIQVIFRTVIFVKLILFRWFLVKVQLLQPKSEDRLRRFSRKNRRRVSRRKQPSRISRKSPLRFVHRAYLTISSFQNNFKH